MLVEKFITSTNIIRHMLVDKAGKPVEPVLRYIKFKDNSNSARSTLRAYCYYYQQG
ncbi:MAG TPA: transposase [Patescibacteria group bacterium]|nr:transposase [Patescibacteria group bacterium]